MDIALIVIVVVCLVFVLRRTWGRTATLGFSAGNATARTSKNSATSKKSAVSKKSSVPRNPYRATSIQADADACGAVMAVAGKRFLDTERDLPVLPLPKCDVARCNCRYQRHEDRRDGQEDQRHPSALKSELYDRTGMPNRRKRKRGRRKTDWS